MSAKFDDVSVSPIQFELDGNFASASRYRVELRKPGFLRLTVDRDICFASFVVRVSWLNISIVVSLVIRPRRTSGVVDLVVEGNPLRIPSSRHIVECDFTVKQNYRGELDEALVPKNGTYCWSQNVC